MLLAAVIIIAVAVKIKAVLQFEQGHIKAMLVLLGFIRIRFHYAIIRDKSSILRLVQIKKDGSEKTKLTLAEIICRLNKKKKTHKEHSRSAGFDYVYRKMRIEIRANLILGLGDAFATAIASGLLKTAFGIMQKAGKPRHHHITINVRPNFQKPAYIFSGDCIITLSPVNIIVGYIIYQKHLRR